MPSLHETNTARLGPPRVALLFPSRPGATAQKCQMCQQFSSAAQNCHAGVHPPALSHGSPPASCRRGTGIRAYSSVSIRLGFSLAAVLGCCAKNADARANTRHTQAQQFSPAAPLSFYFRSSSRAAALILLLALGDALALAFVLGVALAALALRCLAYPKLQFAFHPCSLR